MSDQQDPPRDPRAVSTTAALLGVVQVTVTEDGKITVPADLLAAKR